MDDGNAVVLTTFFFRKERGKKEEEMENQLEEMMNKFDLSRAGFDSGPLEILDSFFERLEQELPPLDDSLDAWDWNDQKNLLGPGKYYAHTRYNFKGKKILYGHNERLGEENIFAPLYGDEGRISVSLG
jgi:hypothetical protein